MSGMLVQKNWTGNIQTAVSSKNLDCGYKSDMDFEQKQRLAWSGDMGLAACAVRLRAARHVAGLQQKEMAEECGVSKTVYNNAEAGSTYPNRAVMKHFYRAYRIDFNFLMNGDFAQLPGDVQERLFPALESANAEWDRKEGSNPSLDGAPAAPRKT